MLRFICPHCHRPLAADALEAVRCPTVVAWACPCCDELIPQAPETRIDETGSNTTEPTTVRVAGPVRA